MIPSANEKFEKSLKTQGLLLPGDTVFVACSGGPDSTALFHLLFSLSASWKLKLGLIHFNHGLRPAANADERFVRSLSKRFKVPFYAGKGAVRRFAKKEKYSLEEAARLARYDFFEKTAVKHKIVKIATAHTLDDQAETILMRLFQGTGLRGLCGIRAQRRQGAVIFVRPLLSFSKKEILGYLRKNRFKYRHDLSNLSEQFLRNRVRLKLIPWLKKEFHLKITEAVARVPAILSEDAHFLESAEAESWKKVFLSKQPGKVCLSRTRFLHSAPALQFRFIDRGLRMLDAKSGFSFEAWQTVRGFLSRASYRHSLPKDIDLILTPSKLMLYKK